MSRRQMPSTRRCPEHNRTVVHALEKWKADRIVAEANDGGQLVETVLRTVDPSLPLTLVHASRGKLTRAEPIAALYEQGKVHHLGSFPELEDELCTGVPGASDSPDRLDGLVWAFTELRPGPVPMRTVQVGVSSRVRAAGACCAPARSSGNDERRGCPAELHDGAEPLAPCASARTGAGGRGGDGSPGQAPDAR